MGLAAVGLTAVGIGNAQASSTKLSANKSPYVLASVGAMTGPEAILGTTELQGEQLAEEQINSAGGVNGRKFEISVFGRPV